MKTLNIKKMGLAVGATGAILYIGCIILMVSVGSGKIGDYFLL